MSDLFLLNDYLLRQNLHGVDPVRIFLHDLIHLSKRPLADELQNLKVIWSHLLLLCLLEEHLQVNLAGDLRIASSARRQWEPALQPTVVFFEVQGQPYVSKERFLIVAIINRNIDLRLFSKDVTVLVSQ